MVRSQTSRATSKYAMDMSAMDGSEAVLTGREMRCLARDTWMSPALKDAFLLLLVVTHQALNTGLGHLDK